MNMEPNDLEAQRRQVEKVKEQRELDASEGGRREEEARQEAKARHTAEIADKLDLIDRFCAWAEALGIDRDDPEIGWVVARGSFQTELGGGYETTPTSVHIHPGMNFEAEGPYQGTYSYKFNCHNRFAGGTFDHPWTTSDVKGEDIRRTARAHATEFGIPIPDWASEPLSAIPAAVHKPKRRLFGR